MARSPTIIYIDRTLQLLQTTKLSSIPCGGRFQGNQIPLFNDVGGFNRQQNCRSWDPDKDRKEVVCKKISGPSSVTITIHHWTHEHRARECRNVSFTAVAKASAAEKRTMVQAEMRCTEENQRKAR